MLYWTEHNCRKHHPNTTVETCYISVKSSKYLYFSLYRGLSWEEYYRSVASLFSYFSCSARSGPRRFTTCKFPIISWCWNIFCANDQTCWYRSFLSTQYLFNLFQVRILISCFHHTNYYMLWNHNFVVLLSSLRGGKFTYSAFLQWYMKLIIYIFKRKTE